jgi:hypothetical protein
MGTNKGYGTLLLALELMNHGFSPAKATDTAIRQANRVARHEPTVRDTINADRAASRNRRKIAA